MTNEQETKHYQAYNKLQKGNMVYTGLSLLTFAAGASAATVFGLDEIKGIMGAVVGGLGLVNAMYGVNNIKKVDEIYEDKVYEEGLKKINELEGKLK